MTDNDLEYSEYSDSPLYDDHVQPSDFGDRDTGEGRALSVDRIYQTLPKVHDVLQEWIKKDFGTLENFLQAFDLSKDDFYNATEKDLGSKSKYNRTDMFPDILAGFANLGINLSILFSEFVPKDILPKQYYSTKEWGLAHISNLKTLNYYEFTKVKSYGGLQSIDISEETLNEKIEKARNNPAVISIRHIAQEKDIILFRQELSDKIAALEASFNLNFPQGYKGKNLNQQKIIENIAVSLGIHPWELFGYIPLDTRRKDPDFKVDDKSLPHYKKNPGFHYHVDIDNIVSRLTDKLFVNENNNHDRAEFYERAHAVLSKKVPYDIDNAIINGPDIPINEIYYYKRVSLKKNQKLDNVIEKGSVSQFESGDGFYFDLKKTLDDYYGFSQNPVIQQKLDSLFQEAYQEDIAQKRIKTSFGKFNKSFEHDSKNIQTAGNYFKKMRLLKMNATLQDVGDILNITRERVRQIEERDGLNLKSLTKISDAYNIPMTDPYMIDILQALDNEKTVKLKKSLDKLEKDSPEYIIREIRIKRSGKNIKQINAERGNADPFLNQWEVAGGKAISHNTILKVADIFGLQMDDPDIIRLENAIKAKKSQHKIRAIRDSAQNITNHTDMVSEPEYAISDVAQEMGTRLLSYITKPNILRPLQKNAFLDIIDNLSIDKVNGYAKRPTGTGKTVIFCAEAIAYNTPVGADEPVWDKPTIILSPTRLGCDQIAQTLIDPEMFDLSGQFVGVYHSGISEKERRKALQKPLLIMTYKALQILVQQKAIDPKNIALAILDEVHNAKGEQTKEIVELFKATSVVQGWTATDLFIHKNSLSHIGHALFNGDSALHRTDFGKAVINREVVPIKNIIFETDIAAQIKNKVSDSEYLNSDIEKIVKYEGRDEAAVKAMAFFVDPETGEHFSDLSSVWYCNGVEHAQKVNDLLNEVFGEGYACTVSGKTPKKELDELVQVQKSGQVRAVVNADLLIEAWDSPVTQLCVMLRPTRSPGIAEQTGGRVARLDRNNPGKIGYVATFVDQNMDDLAIFGEVVKGHYSKPIVDSIIARKTVKPEQIYVPKAKEIQKKSYDIVDLNVYYTEKETIEFFDARDKNRKDSVIPYKEDGWKHKEEFANLLGVSEKNKEYKIFWNELKEKYDRDKKIVINDHEVSSAYMLAGSNTTFYIHESENEFLKKEYSKNHKTASWISKTEFTDKLGIRHDNLAVNVLWEKVENLYNVQQSSPVYINNLEIECGYKKSHAVSPFCVHTSHYKDLKTEAGISDKKDDKLYHTRIAFAKNILGIFVNNNFNNLWDQIERQFNNSHNNKVVIDDHEVDCHYRRTKGNHFHIHESEADFFREKAFIANHNDARNPALKNKTEFSKLIGVHIANKKFDKVWREVEEKYKEGSAIVDDHHIAAQYEKRGPKHTFVLDETEAEWFSLKMGRPLNAKNNKDKSLLP